MKLVPWIAEEKVDDWDWVGPYLSLGFCLTLAHGRTEAELLAGFGVDEPSAEVMDAAEAAAEFTDAEVVRVGRVADWAFGWQAPGAEIGQRDVLVPLSRGGRVLTVWRTGTALSYFEMVADGVPELSFEPLSADVRTGSRESEFAPLLTEVGLLPPVRPDEPRGRSPMVAALTLVTALTGVVLSAEMIEGPLLTGEIDESLIGS